MPNNHAPTPVALPILTAAALAGLLNLRGCASDATSNPGDQPSLPVTTTDPYRGPTIALDSTGPRHLVLIHSPSPGWTVSIDQVRPDRRDVYITLMRPDPRYLYPQMIVEQTLDSTLPASKPARVLARVLDFGATDAPYGLAAESR